MKLLTLILIGGSRLRFDFVDLLKSKILNRATLVIDFALVDHYT